MRFKKKEKDWINKLIIEIMDSYRQEAEKDGQYNFDGKFSKDLPKRELKVMESIHKKINGLL